MTESVLVSLKGADGKQGRSRAHASASASISVSRSWTTKAGRCCAVWPTICASSRDWRCGTVRCSSRCSRSRRICAAKVTAVDNGRGRDRPKAKSAASRHAAPKRSRRRRDGVHLRHPRGRAHDGGGRAAEDRQGDRRRNSGEIAFEAIPARAWTPLAKNIYPIKVPRIRFSGKADMLLVDCPARNLALMPNGLGYVYNALKKAGINFETFDLDIVTYHRYHIRRLFDEGGKIVMPSGREMPTDPWQAENYDLWDNPEVLAYLSPIVEEAAAAIVKAKPKMLGLSIQQCNTAFSRMLVERVKDALPDMRDPGRRLQLLQSRHRPAGVSRGRLHVHRRIRPDGRLAGPAAGGRRCGRRISRACCRASTRRTGCSCRRRCSTISISSIFRATSGSI